MRKPDAPVKILHFLTPLVHLLPIGELFDADSIALEGRRRRAHLVLHGGNKDETGFHIGSSSMVGT
jgi:hypothetical protein